MPSTWKAASLLLTLPLLLAPAAPAENEPVRYQITAEDVRAPVDDWYGIYVEGKKSGHARLQVTRRSSTVVVEMEMLLKLTAMGSQIEMNRVDRKVFEGSSGGLVTSTFDLTVFKGKTIHLAFVYGTNLPTTDSGAEAANGEASDADGWNIDLIKRALGFNRRVIHTATQRLQGVLF